MNFKTKIVEALCIALYENGENVAAASLYGDVIVVGKGSIPDKWRETVEVWEQRKSCPPTERPSIEGIPIPNIEPEPVAPELLGCRAHWGN